MKVIRTRALLAVAATTMTLTTVASAAADPIGSFVEPVTIRHEIREHTGRFFYGWAVSELGDEACWPSSPQAKARDPRREIWKVSRSPAKAWRAVSKAESKRHQHGSPPIPGEATNPGRSSLGRA